MSAVSGLPRRERVLLSVGILGAAFLAWAYLFYDARRMHSGMSCSCADTTAILPLFLMWSVMMIAMMLPGALPLVLTFAGLNRTRRRNGHAYVSAIIFVGGYLVVWFVFSAAAAVAQWLLHRRAWLSPDMASRSALLAGVILVVAGVFQFTPLKRACLTRCRGPMEWIMTRWREGRLGAFRMGIEHGLFCTGCCWALMTLLFIVGVMNLLWVAGLTVLVCIEKLLPRPAFIIPAIGSALIAWGAYVLM
jgi:predicted metal-binding membrane protein